MLPLAVPLIVLAFADYNLYNRLGLVGKWIAISIAHGILATPYAFVLVRASLNNLDPALTRAARSLGANGFVTALHVYWPAMRQGMVGAAVVTFALSFDEVVISYFLQGPDSVTVPVKMFADIRYGLSPDIAAMAVIVVAIALAAAGISLKTNAFRGRLAARKVGLRHVKVR
jgi:putative spermidine/putrescine transport system permease protein